MCCLIVLAHLSSALTVFRCDTYTVLLGVSWESFSVSSVATGDHLGVFSHIDTFPVSGQPQNWMKGKKRGGKTVVSDNGGMLSV